MSIILPAEMSIGGVVYDVLSLLKPDEGNYIKSDMIERAKEMGAHQGKEERKRFLVHQDEIPIAFRGKVVFVFTNDRRYTRQDQVYCVLWRKDRWVLDCCNLRDRGWYGDRFWRVLRRKSVY